jgi:hypothetical protein
MMVPSPRAYLLPAVEYRYIYIHYIPQTEMISLSNDKRKLSSFHAKQYLVDEMNFFLFSTTLRPYKVDLLNFTETR